MTLTLDALAHIIEVAGALPVLWKANRALNRLIDVLKDFPPHRHTNGKIMYPVGFEPAPVETLEQHLAH